MIYACDLERARGLRVGGLARPVDGGGERDGLAEFPAVDRAALEAVDQIGDETFHSTILPWFSLHVLTCRYRQPDAGGRIRRGHVRTLQRRGGVGRLVSADRSGIEPRIGRQRNDRRDQLLEIHRLVPLVRLRKSATRGARQ